MTHVSTSLRIAFVTVALTGVAIAGCHRKRPAKNPQTDPGAAPAASVVSMVPVAPAASSSPGITIGTPPGPVSDADRAAARELYTEAVGLQPTKPREALEKFQRSQAVVAAPTTALHIAQCNVALGHWVEAAEGYRAIGRTELPPNASKPFVDAKAAAGQELAQLEPKIPHLKIAITPERVNGLQVTIDGQALNAALVGIPRPADPGKHAIAVNAPGYAPVEQQVELKEREQKDVAIALKKR